MKSRSHYSHHGQGKKPISFFERLNLLIILPVVLVVISGVIIGFRLENHHGLIPWGNLFGGMGLTLLRLFISYILALVIGVPLALWTQTNRRAEEILLPFFDVLESVPILVFFPVVVIFFVQLGFFNTAAIFIIFVSMLWTVVFSVIGGLKSIPADIFSVAHVFHITGWKKLREITLPAVVPSIVTGSILAWAGGWNIIIVAEVLHTYIPSNIPVHDLFGIGSILVASSANNQKAIFLASVGIIVVVIMILNFFVWQKLLRLSERFKFE